MVKIAPGKSIELKVPPECFAFRKPAKRDPAKIKVRVLTLIQLRFAFIDNLL